MRSDVRRRLLAIRTDKNERTNRCANNELIVTISSDKVYEEANHWRLTPSISGGAKRRPLHAVVRQYRVCISERTVAYCSRARVLGLKRNDLDRSLRKLDSEIHKLAVDRLDILRECAHKQVTTFFDL